MITHTGFKQGDLEWLIVRSGIPTASEMDALITPKFKIKTGDGPTTYLAKKIAETWQGAPLPSFSGFDMEQGQILEAEAIPWFELQFDCAINRVAFITTDDKRLGCSPDGLIGDDCGIEVKCPAAHTHVAYLLAGTLPDDYVMQVHVSMFVTGFKRWKFLSYRRGFPALVLTIERDEEKQAIIAEALDRFTQNFDLAMAQMTKINGGPPRQFKPYVPKPAPEPKAPAPKQTLHQMGITP